MLACRLKQPYQSISLDCISKLFEYNFFKNTAICPLALSTVEDCFVGQVTDQKVLLQILKCLLNAVIGDNGVNGSLLLKSVRIVYNIFLMANQATVQTMAQVTLTQITSEVFTRVPLVYTFDEILAQSTPGAGVRDSDIEQYIRSLM